MILFADDVVLFAKTPTELQQMLHDLNKINSVGLSMNHKKIKLMTNGPPRRIEVQGTDIQYVEEYIHLGQLV